jgi:1,2-diacylglycerol 3-alpha-glucosyltransferase
MADVVGYAAIQAYLPTFCRACDLVVSPSAGVRDVLVQIGVDVPLEVIPNGVDLLPFQKPIDPIDRSELGFHLEDVVLIYIGRLGPEKNLSLLLHAFAGTVQAYDHVRLVLIGDGPERESLTELAKHLDVLEYVRFMGMVPYERVPAFTAMADAFVTASVTEVHPLTVIEAMAAGLPVLGIRSPGISDTIQNGETGYLVQNDELASFTAKMVRLVREQDQRQKMGENARQASQQYSIERTTILMEACYLRVSRKTVDRKRSVQVRFVRWLDKFRR